MTHLLGRCGRLHACMNVWGWGVEFLCMCCVCARPYSVTETFKVTAGSFVFLHVRLCSERISLRKHSLQCPPLCTLFTRHPSGNTHRITMRTGIAYRQQHSDTPPPNADNSLMSTSRGVGWGLNCWFITGRLCS